MWENVSGRFGKTGAGELKSLGFSHVLATPGESTPALWCQWLSRKIVWNGTIGFQWLARHLGKPEEPGSYFFLKIDIY
jgi:hypothetical protein